jgi:hypothetical protein
MCLLLDACALKDNRGAEGTPEHQLPDSETDSLSDLPMIEPPRGAIIPCDLATPLFRWPGPAQGHWEISVNAVPSPSPLRLTVRHNPWEPSKREWEAMKKLALNQPLTMRVVEVHNARAPSSYFTEFTISDIPLDANIVFLDIPVPFALAEKNVTQFRWRNFDPTSYADPAVILERLPYCANCHTFSDNGRRFGLDIDYRGDKGGFILAEVGTRMDIRRNHVISWNDLDRSAQNSSRGLFARISPDGAHVLATVKERPFLIRINDPAYSQLFFPLTGQIAVYSIADGSIRLLEGASDPGVIQTNPAWSHDGHTIAFARGKAAQNLLDALGDKKVLDAPVGEDIHSLNAIYKMQFDLWHVPFGREEGRKASPIQGASKNGMSNYFPRYSPNGKWLVFCMAETGLVSQPSSRLAIMPADGGVARTMRCNRRELNSWHSFSPNGRWLVFSSKEEESSLTRAYLTHINEAGQDAPAISLHRIGSSGRAAILPELVQLPQDGLQHIQLLEP